MKSLFIMLLLSLFAAAPAGAAIYRWLDTDGVIHYVNDLHKVPQKYRGQLGLDLEELEKEAEAINKRGIQPPPAREKPKAAMPSKEPNPGAELFGSKTLEWWIRTFSRVRREKSELTQAIAAKEEFLNIYEGGRGFGKIYTQKSIDRYSRYQEELPGEKERLARKEGVLEDLLRRARNASVPREIRGD